MNRFFIFFIIISLNAQAQNIATESKSPIQYLGFMMAQNSQDTALASVSNFPFASNSSNDKKPVYFGHKTGTMELSNYYSSMYLAHGNIAVSALENYQKLIESPKDVNTSLANAQEVMMSYKLVKPTSTEYVTLPNGKDGFFEFHNDQAQTMNGAIVSLNTITFTATYFNSIPASLINGANVTEHAISKEAIYGSGATPWFVATAPNRSTGVTLELNTDANLMPTNNKGAISINTANGNTLQLGTNDDGGYLKWGSSPSDCTKLTLSANELYIPGRVITENSITSKVGLIAGDKDTYGISISSDALTFTNNGITTYLGNDLNKNTQNPGHNSFIIESNSPGGMFFNSVADASSFVFAFDSNTVGKFMKGGLVIGSGMVEPSAILTIYSLNKGILYPKLLDKQILEIKNPAEGLEVYSLNHHKMVYFNGGEWVGCGCTQKLQSL